MPGVKYIEYIKYSEYPTCIYIFHTFYILGGKSTKYPK